MWLLIGGLAVAAPERCDGLDDDGDGVIDEGPVWSSADVDGDGRGDAGTATLLASCSELAASAMSDATDHDDGDADRFEGAVEVCNGLDDDADGETDEAACGCDATLIEPDVIQVCTSEASWSAAESACSGGGYHLLTLADASEQAAVEAVTAPYAADLWIGLNDRNVEGVFRWSNGTSFVYENWRYGEPNDYGANEDCVEIEASGFWDDDECALKQGYVCETNCVPTKWHFDADGDGLGDPANLVTTCKRPVATVLNSADCDDTDASVPKLAFDDLDGDGFGSSSSARVSCDPDDLGVAGDCDDNLFEVSPDAIELANGLDDDCDGEVDEGTGTPDDTGAAPDTATDTGTFATTPEDEPNDNRRAPPRPSGPDAYGFGLGCGHSPMVGWWSLLAFAIARRARRSVTA
jgi:hypothetical protein